MVGTLIPFFSLLNTQTQEPKGPFFAIKFATYECDFAVPIRFQNGQVTMESDQVLAVGLDQYTSQELANLAKRNRIKLLDATQASTAVGYPCRLSTAGGSPTKPTETKYEFTIKSLGKGTYELLVDASSIVGRGKSSQTTWHVRSRPMIGLDTSVALSAPYEDNKSRKRVVVVATVIEREQVKG